MADEPAAAPAASDPAPAPQSEPVAADPSPATKPSPKVAAPASDAPAQLQGDPRQDAADRVGAALLDSLRNSPVSRNTETWNCLVETAVPAVRDAVLKEL